MDIDEKYCIFLACLLENLQNKFRSLFYKFISLFYKFVSLILSLVT